MVTTRQGTKYKDKSKFYFNKKSFFFLGAHCGPSSVQTVTVQLGVSLRHLIHLLHVVTAS